MRGCAYVRMGAWSYLLNNNNSLNAIKELRIPQSNTKIVIKLKKDN